MTIFWRWRFRAHLAAITLCLYIPCTAADSNQSLESIVSAAASASEERARQHGYDNVSVEVRPLDARLRLPQCRNPLSSYIPQSSQALGPVSVGVGCAEPKPWTIYVRTQVVARRQIPVLVRPLARNTVISQSDLKLIDEPVQSVSNGLIFDPQQIIGMQLIRALDAGSTIRVSQLRPPKVIKRGQQVTLMSGLPGLEVRIQGKALGDAAVGERVSVTNLSSGKQVEGTAHSDGTVRVP